MEKRKKLGQGSLEIITEYLKAHGWNAVMIGPAHIQQPEGSEDFHYELVFAFTGTKTRRPVERQGG
jgi:hypothetical protein